MKKIEEKDPEGILERYLNRPAKKAIWSATRRLRSWLERSLEKKSQKNQGKLTTKPEYVLKNPLLFMFLDPRISYPLMNLACATEEERQESFNSDYGFLVKSAFYKAFKKRGE